MSTVFSISEQEIADCELPEEFTAKDYDGAEVAALIRKFLHWPDMLEYIAMCIETDN